MAPRKRTASQAQPDGTIVATGTTVKSATAIPTSKIPRPLRFPLAVLLNLSLSTLLYTVVSEFTAGDLATVSRSVNDWSEILALLGCKIAELGVAWVGGFDGYDVASLTLLTHFPPLYLLTTFYGIRPSTLISSLAVDLAATSIPFYLLRPALPPHQTVPARGSIANRAIIADAPTQGFTSLLAATIQATVLTAAYLTFLPHLLAIHFTGLHDIRPVYGWTNPGHFPLLITAFLPLGLAAKILLFTPSAAAKRDSADATRESFDPQTATLAETFLYNVWGFRKGVRELVLRSAVLAGVTLAYGWVQVFASVEGVESAGALGWASIWAASALVTGAVFGWVQSVGVGGWF